jgi:hypothetical protein
MNRIESVKGMTKIEYVKLLAKVYYAANMSDATDVDGTSIAPDWMKGDECSVHCRAIDKIVCDMGLSEIWGNIIEGDCLDQI